MDIRASEREKKDQRILSVAKCITIMMNVWQGIFLFIKLNVLGVSSESITTNRHPIHFPFRSYKMKLPK